MLISHDDNHPFIYLASVDTKPPEDFYNLLDSPHCLRCTQSETGELCVLNGGPLILNRDGDVSRIAGIPEPRSCSVCRRVTGE